VESFRFAFGHSLGEFSALCATSALSLRDTIQLVRDRGIAMQNCVGEESVGMAALFPVDLQTARELTKEARSLYGKVVEVSNINSPLQIVISGHSLSIDAAIVMAPKYGKIRSKKLSVSAPFHCSLMQPAAEDLAFRLSLKNADNSQFFKKPVIPIISNVTAQQIQDPSIIKTLLVQQVTSAVRWSESVQYAKKHGVTKCLELGAGTTLSGLVKQTEPSIQCASLGTVADIKAFISQFKS